MGNVSTSGNNYSPIGNTFKISPNPTSDYLNLSVFIPIFEWEILNVSGKQILKGNSETETTRIPVSQLKSGMYIIRIKSGSIYQPLVSKFIKE